MILTQIAPVKTVPRCSGQRHGLALVDMPFSAVTQPNLGLSLIKSIVQKYGYPVSIHHLNLAFAASIGPDIYRLIAEHLPQEHLFGDLVFSTLLRGQEPHGHLTDLTGTRDVNRATSVPDWLLELLPELQDRAAEFIANAAPRFASLPAPVLGFNVMFQTVPALALAKAVKELAPGKLIILGGSNCEGSMGLALHRNFPWIDFVCQGEGEELIIELLAALRGDGQFDRIAGLVWRRHGLSIQNTGKARRVSNLDTLPVASHREWLDELHCHLPEADENDLWLPIETSRGCWFGEKSHCIFCGLTGDSLKYRTKSPERVLREMESLKETGIQKIFAVDLIFPQTFFASLLPRMAKERFGLTIFFEVKSNLTRTQLEALKRAGISSIQPGIESLSTPVLQLMKKGVTALQNLRLLRWAAELGVNCFWNLLYGFPAEEPADYDRMASLIPWITHLRPPVDGCCRVRIDRFSPLFESLKGCLGEAIAPAPAYNLVYHLPDPEIWALAYFFRVSIPDAPNPDRYVRRLREEVRHWHAQIGHSSLISLTVGEGVLISDRRPAAKVGSAVLTARTLAVYKECVEGASVASISSRTGIPDDAVRAELAYLSGDCGWVVEIDNRYLSVAVTMDELVPSDIPAALREEAGHVLCRRRMKEMCERSRVDLQQPRQLWGSKETVPRAWSA